MDEYVASLEDVRMIYVFEDPVAAYDLVVRERRERAFDRMIRNIQDEYYDEGFEAAQWEFED